MEALSEVMSRFKEGINQNVGKGKSKGKGKPKGSGGRAKLERPSDNKDVDLFNALERVLTRARRNPSGIIDRVSTVIEQLRRKASLEGKDSPRSGCTPDSSGTHMGGDSQGQGP